MIKLALCVVVLVALGDAAVYPKGSWADRGQYNREINHHEQKKLKEPFHQEHGIRVEKKPLETANANIEYQRIDAIREALERDEHIREARSKHSHDNYHYGHNRHSSESDSSDSSGSSESHENNNYGQGNKNHGQGRYYKQGYQQSYGWQGGYHGGYHR